MTPIFCLKRLIYALATVYLGNFVVPNIYIYIFVPLFSIGYILNNKPMYSKLLNVMETLNELIILLSGYFLTIFTQWICDPKERYRYGWVYVACVVLAVFINFVIILYEMFVGLRKEFRKKMWLRAWDKAVKQ